MKSGYDPRGSGAVYQALRRFDQAYIALAKCNRALMKLGAGCALKYGTKRLGRLVRKQIDHPLRVFAVMIHILADRRVPCSCSASPYSLGTLESSHA